MNRGKSEISHSNSLLPFLIPMIILVAFAIYLGATLPSTTGSLSHSVSTFTRTSTLRCPTAIFENQTTTSQNRTTVNSLPNFGPLFGNFSQMTVELYGNDSTGNSVTNSSFTVLNRNTYNTSSGTATEYEVNITTVAIEPNVAIEGTPNYTTTIVSPGNHTYRQSNVAYFWSNESMIPTIKSNVVNENSSAVLMGITDMMYFYPLVTQSFSNSTNISNGAPSVINKTTFTIGSIKMAVTNYMLPALTLVIIQEGCPGEPAVTTRTIISYWTVQKGVVPGTSFLLLTRYHQTYSVNSNSTSPFSSELNVNWKVTSFTVS